MGITLPDSAATVIVNGRPFAGWLAFQVVQSFDKASGELTLRMSPQPGVPLPIMKGDKVQLLLGKRPVINGYVMRIWGEHSISSHVIQAQVRDKTQDLVDSTVGPKLNIDPPVRLSEVAQRTLSVMGLNDISVIDKVNAEPFERGEKVSSEIDTRGFDFIEDWAKKRHSVLNTDGNGNLVIDQNKGEMLAGAKLHFGLPDDPMNNVIKSQFGVDDFDKHNSYAEAGQKSPNDRKHWESRPKSDPDAQAKTVSNRYGVAYDRSVRPQRRKHRRGGRGMQGRTPRESAKWRANSMRAKSNEYVATVAGFTTALGEVWWPGKLVPVYDYWWEISSTLFLKEVEFGKDRTKGSITQLRFGLEDSFKDQAGRSQAAGRTGGALPGDPGEKYDTVSPGDLGIDEAEVDRD